MTSRGSWWLLCAFLALSVLSGGCILIRGNKGTVNVNQKLKKTHGDTQPSVVHARKVQK